MDDFVTSYDDKDAIAWKKRTENLRQTNAKLDFKETKICFESF